MTYDEAQAFHTEITTLQESFRDLMRRLERRGVIVKAYISDRGGQYLDIQATAPLFCMRSEEVEKAEEVNKKNIWETE